jgi:hypothetical protein
MAARKRAATPARRRKRAATPARRKTTTRRRTTRRKGMGDLFSRNEAQAGFEMLVGVGAGYVLAEQGGKFLNPNGDKNLLEIAAKIGGGFLVATTGRMPNLGAGIAASGVKKILEKNQGLADNGQKVQYLAEQPQIRKSNYVLADNGEMYLADYQAAYSMQGI